MMWLCVVMCMDVVDVEEKQIPICGVCSELNHDTTTVSTMWCDKCETYLCTTHDDEEHRTVAACRHILVAASSHEPIPTCTQHKLELQLYCTKCDVLICTSCYQTSIVNIDMQMHVQRRVYVYVMMRVMGGVACMLDVPPDVDVLCTLSCAHVPVSCFIRGFISCRLIRSLKH